MEETLKEQIQDTVSKISRDAKALCGASVNRKIGELIALVRALPDSVEKSYGKGEHEMVVNHCGLDIKVFFDYQPEEPATRGYPGCPEVATVNHKEIINDAVLEEAVLDEIAARREAAIESEDFFYSKKIGR